jgi:hypothetical protein
MVDKEYMSDLTQEQKMVLPEGEELQMAVQNPQWREAFATIFQSLPEDCRRWNAGLLAIQLGYGGMKIACELSGLSFPAVHRGRREVETGQADWDSGRIRKSGGGRKKLEQNHPEVIEALQQLFDGETAGDPRSDARWVNRSSRKLAAALKMRGYTVSHTKVIDLLKKLD